MFRRMFTAEEIRIGTSGWSYGHWRGRFYPRELPARQWLAYYQRRFSTVELNASFYRRIRPSTWARWRQQSPPGFLWAVKAHREITHQTRLQRRTPLRRFLQSVAALGDRLGAILFQLPPSLSFDARVVKRFLGWLPPGLRYAVEPRHRSWFAKQPLALLRRHGVALCMADCGRRFPSARASTAASSSTVRATPRHSSPYGPGAWCGGRSRRSSISTTIFKAMRSRMHAPCASRFAGCCA